jgi:hypothetical protein
MEQSPSRETDNPYSDEELPHLLEEPKDHCHVHKSPLLNPILSQINPLNIVSLCSYKV